MYQIFFILFREDYLLTQDKDEEAVLKKSKNEQADTKKSKKANEIMNRFDTFVTTSKQLPFCISINNFDHNKYKINRDVWYISIFLYRF